jgi:hypothetical protein
MSLIEHLRELRRRVIVSAAAITVGTAVAFALHTQGIHGDVALSMGIAFNAVETVSSLAFGAGGALYLATGSSRVRPRLAAFAGATACAALAGAFSLTVFAPLG